MMMFLKIDFNVYRVCVKFINVLNVFVYIKVKFVVNAVNIIINSIHCVHAVKKVV